MKAKGAGWAWRISVLLISIFWLVMVGLLVQRHHISALPRPKSIPKSLENKEQWASIYLYNQKVGYSVTTMVKNEAGYLLGEQTFMQLKVMDQPQQVTTYTLCQVDDGFLLKSFTFRLTSGLTAFKMYGKIREHILELIVETEGGKSQKEIPVPEIPFLSPGLKPFLVHSGMKVGEHHRLPLWDPTTQSYRVVVMEVEKRESITINNQDFLAFCIRTEFMGMNLRSWITEEGDLLKEEGPMGIIVVKSAKEQALTGIPAESLDLLSATSVSSTPIQNPRICRYLKIRLGGVKLADFDIGGGRQRVEEDMLEIVQEKILHERSYQVPCRDKAYSDYLQPSLLIQSNHPEILRTAKEIIGSERNSLNVSKLLTDWVYSHIQKRPTLSIPSAIDVLKNKVGDCNEHAALLAALLRATGIPARTCVGLIHSGGHFYYHAWLEAYLADWVSVDPVLNQVPADATHVRFIEGDLSRQMEMLKVVGKIRVEVMETK